MPAAKRVSRRHRGAWRTDARLFDSSCGRTAARRTDPPGGAGTVTWYLRGAEPALGETRCRSGSVEAQAPPHLVLVHDRVGVPAGDTRVVGEPMGSLIAAEERGTRFEPVEPLSEAAAGNDRNACDEASVQIR